MDLLRSILLFGHLIGMAFIISPFIYGLKGEVFQRIQRGQWHGSILTVSTGTLLVIVHSLGQAHTDLNHLKIAVKFVIALCILILARLDLNKQPMPQLLTAVGLLGLINTAFASIW
jgi:uncharacterized membrane protein YjjP (DUF1212 family)